MSVESCRIDLWLWRARFARTRGDAASMVERGLIRLTHHGAQTRLDKPSRSVHPGDALTFVIHGRATSVVVEALGERRGPAEEARGLYSQMDAPG